MLVKLVAALFAFAEDKHAVRVVVRVVRLDETGLFCFYMNVCVEAGQESWSHSADDLFGRALEILVSVSSCVSCYCFLGYYLSEHVGERTWEHKTVVHECRGEDSRVVVAASCEFAASNTVS